MSSNTGNFRCKIWGDGMGVVDNAECFMRAYWLEDFFQEVGFFITPKWFADVTVLPRGIDLNQVDSLVDRGEFPLFKGLAPVILWCAFFCLFRFVLERTVFKNLAATCMSVKIEKEKDFPQFEKISKGTKKLFFSLMPKPSLKKSERNDAEAVKKFQAEKERWDKQVQEFSDKNGVDLKVVMEFQKFRKVNKDSQQKISKFVEAFWRGVFYLWFIILGYKVLFNCDVDDPTYNGSCESNGIVEWINDLQKNWKGYPYHRLPEPIRLYYYVELGCYIHQLIWLDSVTTSRKDAIEMILHHVATIVLLLMSYLTNHYRVGSIILMVHDVADIWLEFGKCIKYTSLNNKSDTIKKYANIACDGLFFPMFVITFFVSRLIYYPFYILFSYFFHGFLCFPNSNVKDVANTWRDYDWSTIWVVDPNNMDHVRGCSQQITLTDGTTTIWWRYGFNWLGGGIFTFCLLLLQILHVYWFYLIMRMVVRMLVKGEVEGDIRSDAELDDDASLKAIAKIDSGREGVGVGGGGDDVSNAEKVEKPIAQRRGSKTTTSSDASNLAKGSNKTSVGSIDMNKVHKE